MELVLEFVKSVVVLDHLMGRRFCIDAVLDVGMDGSFVPRRAQRAALPFMKGSV
jgi:hypothetical protein